MPRGCGIHTPLAVIEAAFFRKNAEHAEWPGALGHSWCQQTVTITAMEAIPRSRVFIAAIAVSPIGTVTILYRRVTAQFPVVAAMPPMRGRSVQGHGAAISKNLTSGLGLITAGYSGGDGGSSSAPARLGSALFPPPC